MSREVKLGGSTLVCELGLYNSGSHFKLGEIFLKNHYSIYDIDNYKVGLAPVIHQAVIIPETPEEDPQDEVEEEVEPTDSDTAEIIPDHAIPDQVNPTEGDSVDYHKAGIWMFTFTLFALILTGCVLKKFTEKKKAIHPDEYEEGAFTVDEMIGGDPNAQLTDLNDEEDILLDGDAEDKSVGRMVDVESYE